MERMRGEILLFAGTTEGRLLAEFIVAQGIGCQVCVATEYGGTLLKPAPGLKVRVGRLDQGGMERLLREEPIGMVVDATHPYAVEVTKQIQAACHAADLPYVRCLRGRSPAPEGEEDHIVTVDSVSEAVRFLRQTEGKILIATGSKELKAYTEIEDYQTRCYARVLSTREAVAECTALGFEGKHLIAMQGPFSRELNAALLRHTDAKWFVTKESGKAGGFSEKADAAKEAGAKLVVIGRPVEEGLSLEEVKAHIFKQEIQPA